MNPIMFTIGGFEVRWYSVLILIGFLVAYLFINREAKRFNIKSDFVFNMLFWVLIFGVIGARLYYFIFDFASFKDNPMDIFKIWNGGLAIHGGIIAGLLTLIVYTKRYKFRTIRYVDFCVVGLIIAQAVGRWGNFFNSEAHGVVTTLEHLQGLHVPQFIIDGMYINGLYYTHTFFYESLSCVVGFVMLLIVRRNKYIKVGDVTALYLIYYSIVRIFIEASRTDSLMFLGFKMAQIISIIMIIIGIIILIINRKKGKFEDLYNDKNNVDIIRF